MKVTIPFCDICKEDGRLSLAVAEYEGEINLLHCCKKHLKEIKSYDMKYYLLNKTFSDYIK
jgi:hypothetical protein